MKEIDGKKNHRYRVKLQNQYGESSRNKESFTRGYKSS